MRKCENCYNEHYNLGNDGEELYCDEMEYIEEKVKETDVCEFHRYYPGMEEEKNYMFYDDTYLAPGYLIINTKAGEINKFLKFYTLNLNDSPILCVRAYSKNPKDDSKEDFSDIEFTFRDLEDNENNLFNLFSNLCYDLNGKRVFSIDSKVQGRNNLKLDSNSKVTTMTLYKDNIQGTQNPTNFIDILIGDSYTCNTYKTLIKFYKELSKKCSNKISSEDVKKLILTK